MTKTPLLVLDVVGLTPRLLDHMPRLRALGRRGARAELGTVLPAVTCAAQATFLTGTPPAEHGIVGNGWYFRDECEIKFWKQASPLVQRPRIWDIGRQRNAKFTCANVCWWYAMYASADYTVTPRPMYPADGRRHHLPVVGRLAPVVLDDLGAVPRAKNQGDGHEPEGGRTGKDGGVQREDRQHARRPSIR